MKLQKKRNLPIFSDFRGFRGAARPVPGASLLLVTAAALFLWGCATEKPGVVPLSSVPESADIQTLLTNKTWILCGMQFEGQFLPLEPAHGGNNVLYFYTNGNFESSSGSNLVSGTWKLSAPKSDESAGIAFRLASSGGETHPDKDAARFESAYVNAFRQAETIDAYGNQFSLYGKDGKTLLTFILNNPDW